ncbi:MAG: DUF4114 domain-containing protein, partial [Alphaproteobacteria bacterium]|nr:DUF4114 domain-containing protein [Alphaproteobacteria bacterium]
MTHRKRLRPALLALAALPLASPALADSSGYVTIKSGTIESSILQSVAANLPESRAVGAAFLNPAYDPNLRISEAAHVSASFISEGAGYRNSLGYFTFGESTFANLSRGAIDANRDGVVSLKELGNLSGVTTGWLFQNASAAGSGGSLKAGDAVTLNGGKPLAAGTRVGFFLVQDGWTGSGVTSGAYNGNANVFYTVDMLNPENAQTATAGGYDVSPYAR